MTKLGRALKCVRVCRDLGCAVVDCCHSVDFCRLVCSDLGLAIVLSWDNWAFRVTDSGTLVPGNIGLALVVEPL